MIKIFTGIGKKLKSYRVLTNSNQFLQSMPYYAVAAGWEVGIFDTWPECEAKVKGFSKSKFKKFNTIKEAEDFLKTHGVKMEVAVRSYNPRNDAVPLVHTPKKNEKSFKQSLRELLKEHKIPKSKCQLLDDYDPLKEEDSSDEEVKPPPEVKNSWPEDVKWEADDEDILLAAAAEVEGLPENPLKRTHSSEFSGSGSSKVLKKYSHESKIWEPIGLKKIGNFEFPIDSEGFVIVYTDGSCINNGRANAIAGYGVYFSENHGLNAAKPVTGRVTNNAGEIQAAIYAIRIAKDFGIRKLCLSTDSQFLINAVTSWIKGWKRKGWKLKTGEPVKNKEDFEVLDELLDGSITIKWNYVKGHKGIVGNEKADRLAREGAALYKAMLEK